jgi:hypothetical protein
MKYLLAGGIIIVSAYAYVNFSPKKVLPEHSVIQVMECSSEKMQPKPKPIEKVITKTIQSCQGNEVNWKIPSNVKSITVYYKNKFNETLFSKSFSVDPHNVISLKVDK